METHQPFGTRHDASCPVREDMADGYRAAGSQLRHGTTDNCLVFAENLNVLRYLAHSFAGRVQCVYIDPPYNTGNSFRHYRDELSHARWLAFMRARLELLWSVLGPQGFLAVQIDDREFARLYLLLVDICAEENLKVIVVKMAEPTGVKMAHVIDYGGIPRLKEYVLLAGKAGPRGLRLERVPKADWDPEYHWVILGADRSALARLQTIVSDHSRSPDDVQAADWICARFRLERMDAVCRAESGRAPTARWLADNAWRIARTCATSTGAKRLADNKRPSAGSSAGAFTIETPRRKLYIITSSYDGRRLQPRIRLLFADHYLTVHPGDLWQDIKTTGLGREGGVDFVRGKKPEALLRRIIGMTTRPGDWVLDAFAGSGTTGAVAHKLGRRWILIEEGPHCETHILPRLRGVVDGTDQTGISRAVGWAGGGGFRFFRTPAG